MGDEILMAPLAPPARPLPPAGLLITYSVSFPSAGEALGLQLRIEGRGDLVVYALASLDPEGGTSAAERSGVIQAGDTLYGVNSIDMRGWPLPDALLVVGALQHTHTGPLMLHFMRTSQPAVKAAWEVWSPRWITRHAAAFAVTSTATAAAAAAIAAAASARFKADHPALHAFLRVDVNGVPVDLPAAQAREWHRRRGVGAGGWGAPSVLAQTSPPPPPRCPPTGAQGTTSGWRRARAATAPRRAAGLRLTAPTRKPSPRRSRRWRRRLA
jgi:hypothetical protein